MEDINIEEEIQNLSPDLRILVNTPEELAIVLEYIEATGVKAVIVLGEYMQGYDL